MVVTGNGLLKKKVDQAHTYNARTWERDKDRVISELEASLVYRLHSVIARVIQRSPVWRKPKGMINIPAWQRSVRKDMHHGL